MRVVLQAFALTLGILSLYLFWSTFRHANLLHSVIALFAMTAAVVLWRRKSKLRD